MVIIKKSIVNMECLKIQDIDAGTISYGCNQEWYGTKWQRLSGCGPTVATNLFLYLNYKTGLSTEYKSKKDCVMLMEKMWKFVTPTIRGVNKTKIFYKGLYSYTKLKNMDACYEFIDIPKKKSERPEFVEVLKFIENSLKHDFPVAFLNLCNGEEEGLDSWHWVTVVSLDHSEESGGYAVEILDEGTIKRVNLALWFDTTKLGGGFVSFFLDKALDSRVGI